MRALCVMVVALACTAPAFGQAQNADDLQPGVNTSALPPQPPAPAAAKTASSAPAAAPSAASAAKAAPSATAGKAAHGGKASDRIDLDTTQITGNKELPKVMYVVPWKRSDLGDLTGKPANSLIDEVLQPVDRDVFNREERYYHTVAPEKSSPPPQTGAPTDH
jgi:hypothetical protein